MFSESGLLLDGAVVVALVERLEVEGLRGLRAPQPQHVRGVHAVAEDRGVVGDALHHAVGQPATRSRPAASVAVSVRPPRNTGNEISGRGDLPRVPESQPVVRRLHLPAVADRLVEDAVLVADAVADRGDLEGRERVEVARGEAAEAPVAEPRLLLLRDHLVEAAVHLGERLPHLLLDAQVQQVVREVRPEQELGREVADRPAALARVGRGRREPALDEPVADRERDGEVPVVRRRHGREAGERVIELVGDRALPVGDAQADR